MKQPMIKRFSVDELKVGMFVSALDCPMVTTPFPLDGFYIRNTRQVVELTRYCCFVFVDVVKSLALSTLAEGLRMAPVPAKPAFNPNPQPKRCTRPSISAATVCRQQRGKHRVRASVSAAWAMVCVPLMLSLVVYGESAFSLLV